MRTNFLYALTLGVLAISLITPQPAEANEPLKLSLDDAIEIGLEHSRTLKIADLQVSGSESDVKIARRSFLPDVSLTGVYTRLDERPYMDASNFGNLFEPIMAPFENLVDGGYLDPSTLEGLSGGSADRIYMGFQDNYSLGLQVQQPLFTGFALRNSYELSRRILEAQKSQREWEGQKLILSVTEGYVGLFQARRVAEISEQSLIQVRAHLNDLRSLHEEGIVLKNDVLRAEVYEANAELFLTQIQNASELAREYLCHLLGLDLDTEIELAGIETAGDSTSLPSVESLKMQAISQRPDLEALGSLQAAGSNHEAIERSRYYPKLALIANFDLKNPNREIEQEFYGSWNASLVMSMDLFDWGRTRNRISKVQAENRILKEQMGMLEDGIRLEIQRAFSEIHEAEKTLELARKSVAQAEENYRVSEMNFQEGMVTSSDLLDTQTLLTKSRVEESTAEAKLSLAHAALRNALGEAPNTKNLEEK